MERGKIGLITPSITYSKKGSSFDIKAASLYSAAIHISGNKIDIGFSDPQSGELLHIDQYEKGEPLDTQSLINTLTQSSLCLGLKSAIKNTFYVTTSRFSIVPSAFFTVETISDWKVHSFELEESEELISKFIPEIDSHIIFPVSSILKNELKSKIGHTEFGHHFASLISTYHIYYRETVGSQLFIHFHSTQFSLALFEDEKMVLFNVYDMKSWEDILYYTYYCLEQFNFSPSQTKINLGGYFEYISELTTALQRYSKHIFHLKAKGIDSIDATKEAKLLSTIFNLQCG